MKKLLVSLIKFYQIFSFDKGILAIFAPGGACKYETSCAEYTRQMIVKQGAYGVLLGVKRIWSCR